MHSYAVYRDWSGPPYRLRLFTFMSFVTEVKWVTLKFLGTKVPCTLGWPFTEGTWLYCDYFIWYVSCSLVVLTCFVICGCVYVWVLYWVAVCICGFCNVWVFWKLCGCFRKMCTCIYCVLNCLYCVSVLFCLGTFILICYQCKDYCRRVKSQLQ